MTNPVESDLQLEEDQSHPVIGRVGELVVRHQQPPPIQLMESDLNFSAAEQVEPVSSVLGLSG